MPTPSARLDLAVAALPRAFPGPGGACAVLHEGRVLVRHAWGYANAERHIPFTPKTLFRICSISKQFTCAALLDAFPDLDASGLDASGLGAPDRGAPDRGAPDGGSPDRGASDRGASSRSVLDPDAGARLPALKTAPPGILHLCHNQSGLRDYWAVAMLHGSPAEAPFGDTEAARIIGGTETLQFAPGTRYSYCNQNFRLISDILQDRTGRSFAELLRTRIFARAGMDTAFLAANTAAMPDGTEGYEGSPETGFRAAVNRVVWTGDAGIGASLDDMIAWEKHIDATRDDPRSLYRRLSAPVHFADGAPAPYGFGLGRRPVLNRAATGHGGALRGWRSHRINLPAERLSVIVFFNHLSDAHEAAVDLLRAVLDEPHAARAPAAMPAWVGAYLDPETGLCARVEPAAAGQLRLRFGHSPETLDMREDGSAGNDATSLRPDADGLRMHRSAENQSTVLRKLPPPGGPPPGGQYVCRELGAGLIIADAGGVPHGAFSGFLGQGRMEALTPVGRDVWALPCPRALDHTPPGDWTLRLTETGDMEVGCWLARGLVYRRGG